MRERHCEAVPSWGVSRAQQAPEAPMGLADLTQRQVNLVLSPRDPLSGAELSLHCPSLQPCLMP